MKTLLVLVLLATPCAVQNGENWPGFRGPTGQGVSTDPDPPLELSATSNILWKTPIPGEGWSSPVVWNDRVYVTAATDGGTKCHVYGLDRADGKILWDTVVFEQAATRKEGKNSYATPTPCTDGERVYAVFGEGGVAALDLDGKLVWTNRDVRFYSRHGLGASPVLFRKLLIMPYDGSNRVTEAGQWPNNSPEEQLGWRTPWDKAEIAALDVATGRRVWTGKRGQSRIAHASPILLDQGGKTQMISIAGDAVQGFDPETGERLWSAYCQGEGLVPTPVAGEGLIFTSSGYEKTTLRGIRLGGTGDVTATHIAWEQKKGVPTQPSMIYSGPHLFAVTESGVASCYKAATGEIVWQDRIADKQSFSASPVLAAGRIYMVSETGETTVFAAGPEFKVLARNKISEKCQASPAFSRGAIYLRTEKNLYAIGRKS